MWHENTQKFSKGEDQTASSKPLLAWQMGGTYSLDWQPNPRAPAQGQQSVVPDLQGLRHPKGKPTRCQQAATTSVREGNTAAPAATLLSGQKGHGAVDLKKVREKNTKKQ